MSFFAKSAMPLGAPLCPALPAVAAAAEAGVTVLAAPAGYLAGPILAAALAAAQRPIIWLRLGSEDHDPATFILSLLDAASQLCPQLGEQTRMAMRRTPGPTFGWSPLFNQLARELGASLPANTALVLEDVHQLNQTPTTLALIKRQLLPALPGGFACVLATHHDLHPTLLPDNVQRYGPADLRLSTSQTGALAQALAADLPHASIQRLVALTDGRAADLYGLLVACQGSGRLVVERAAELARSGDDLLGRVARSWAATTASEQQQALALTLCLGYSNPALRQAVFGTDTPPEGPWLQPLQAGWVRVEPGWHDVLRGALRAGVTLPCVAQQQAAQALAILGATEQAIPLFFAAGQVEAAADTLVAVSEAMMNFGQWELLSDWIERLPGPALRARPTLVYVTGEIAMAQGRSEAARQAFAAAAALFGGQNDVAGACRSILAESALAAWEGDTGLARTRAGDARTLAELAGLALQQSWAAWQLGCLTALADRLDDALIYFGHAAEAAAQLDDQLLAEVIQAAEVLARQQRDLRRQREYFHQAYWATHAAEQAAAGRLRELLSAPPEHLNALLDARGWSQTPLLLKLPAPARAQLEAPPPAMMLAAGQARPGLWHRMLTSLGLRRNHQVAPATETPRSLLAEPAPTLTIPALPAMPSLASAPGGILLTMPEPVLAGQQHAPALVAPERPVSEYTELPAPTTEAEPPGAPGLSVQFFGQFQVSIVEQRIESWPSGRGRAVFKYLLAHRDKPIARDLLMDIFWPNASPEQARNNLNVAVHGLRQALRSASDIAVVLFQDGAYRLNPELTIWADTQAFEQSVSAGRQFEAAGEFTSAIARYDAAINLYQGDFLEDDPYDDWPVLVRERLKDAYMDTLARLSQIYFSQSQYSACATLCQRMLARDNLREDIHCRLMRCYARQGQYHLAVRQYQLCADTLRAELEFDPAPATVQLYERIRRRERV